MRSSIDKSVFRVKSRETANSDFGTSFIIYRDETSTYLLTCAHVIDDVGGEDCVCIEDDEAEVVAMGAHDGLDLAVLRIKRLLDQPSLLLGADGAAGDTVELFGFRKFDKYHELNPVSYKLGKKTWLDSNVVGERIPAWALGAEEQEKDDHLKPGYSGAPVVAKKSGRVLGVVSHQLGEGQRARAISIRALRDLWPTMPSNLLPVEKSPQRILTPGPMPEEEKESSGEPKEHSVHCFVILSETDENAYWTLRTAVDTAVELLSEKEKVFIGKPHYEVATKIVSSKPNFEAAIIKLCTAHVAIFDVTHFEPAVMLLLGIRAVVRRGVTILSIGGDYAIGDQVYIPFNITDANLVAHSKKQWEEERRKPNDLLKQRIQRGLEQIHSTYYLDLAVFDAVRKLPAARRGIISDKEGALVLCSFKDPYSKEIWKKHLKVGLDHQLKRLRGGSQEEPTLGIARSFELESPRLVSQAIYEHIRRIQTCIADWTMWSPNVFFELGIRLAASRERTVCVIEEGFRENTAQLAQNPGESIIAKLSDQYNLLDEEASNPDNVRFRIIARQCLILLDLFYVFSYKRNKAPLADNSYKDIYGVDALLNVAEDLPSEDRIGPSSGHVHRIITHAVDVAGQPASRSVYMEILDAAMLFGRDPQTSKPVGLYPGNTELLKAEAGAELERLLAAWYFLIYHYGKEQILANVNLSRVTSKVVNTLLANHFSALQRYQEEDTPGKDFILEQLMELQPDLPEPEELEN